MGCQRAIEIVASRLHLHREHRKLEAPRFDVGGLRQIDVLLQDDRLEARAAAVLRQPLPQERLLHAEDSRKVGEEAVEVEDLLPGEADIEGDAAVHQDAVLGIAHHTPQRHERHAPQPVVIR